MRLKQLKLKNFRAYRGEVSITFDDLTALIGKNDVGKSTILDALSIFFDEKTAVLDCGDLCVTAEDDELRIGCVFTELPKSLVLDADAETTLKNEYLLNSDGDLEIHRTWKISDGKKPEKLVVAALHPTKAKVDQLLLKKNTELKSLAATLEVDLEGVDVRSNPALRSAIWSSQEELGIRDVDVSLGKEDAKTIWQKLQGYLPTFALFRADRPSTDEDSEVQDPMKFAIKEAMRTVADDLERIKEQVQKRALGVATRTLGKLQDLAPDLASELQPTFKKEPQWEGIFKLSLTGDDQIPINKRGSGVRRLILLSFFRAEAERLRSEQHRHDIIYAIEEPETSQHPGNQRMIIDALLGLAEEEGCQVMLTTHVPALAGQVPIDSLRHVTRSTDGTRQVEGGGNGSLAQIADDLGVLPDRRVRVIMCLEGPNDVQFMRNIAVVLNDETIADLISDPRIAVIPLGGSTLKDWVNEHYLRSLEIPEVHIYDRDVESPPKNQEAVNSVNARGDGSVAFLTTKREIENYLHPDAVRDSCDLRIEIDDDSDIPELVAMARHAARGHETEWIDLSSNNRKRCTSFAKRLLNDQATRAMSVERLDSRGGKEEVLQWFSAISEHLE